MNSKSPQITLFGFAHFGIDYYFLNFILNNELKRSCLFLDEFPEWWLIKFLHDSFNDKLYYHFVNHYFVVQHSLLNCSILDFFAIVNRL